MNDPNPTRRTYLGDSVYVEVENGMLKFTTWNGYADDPRNVIYMEWVVWQAALKYMEKLGR